MNRFHYLPASLLIAMLASTVSAASPDSEKSRDRSQLETKPRVLTPESLPEGIGRDIINESCTRCHELGHLTIESRAAEERSGIPDPMPARGSRGSQRNTEEYYRLLNYRASPTPTGNFP